MGPWIGELCALGAALIWSVSVILFKRSEAVSPQAINLYKNVSASLLLGLTLLVMGESIPADRSATDWARLAASGVLGISIADTMIFAALRRLGAARLAVVDCTYAPVSVAMGVLLLGEPMKAMFLVGGVLVVGGVLFATTEPLQSTELVPDDERRNVMIGAAGGIGGIALMAFGVILAKPVLDSSGLVDVTFVRLVFGVLGQLVWMAIDRRQREALGVLKPSKVWVTLLPASVLGSYLAMLLWLGGFKWASVSVASVLNQLSAMFTMILAWVFLKETFSVRRLVGAVGAIGGAILVIVSN